MMVKTDRRFVIPSSWRTCLPRLMSSRLEPTERDVYVEADEGAESGAIDVGEIGEIEDDAPGIGHELPDPG
jgi:hypothetical protein